MSTTKVVNTECLSTAIKNKAITSDWNLKENVDSVHILKWRKIFKENKYLVSRPIYIWVLLVKAGTHSCWCMPNKIWEKQLNENKRGDAICSTGNTMVKNSKWCSTFANNSKLLTALNTVGNAVPLWAQLLHKRGRHCFVFQFS